MGLGEGPAYGVVATNFTPLMVAAEKCDNDKFGPWLKVIELLLAHGADINARTSDGKSAADYARRSNCDNSKIAEFLEVSMLLPEYKK
jgi:ankyrin repeat protein